MPYAALQDQNELQSNCGRLKAFGFHIHEAEPYKGCKRCMPGRLGDLAAKREQMLPRG